MKLQLILYAWIISLGAHYFLWYESNWFEIGRLDQSLSLTRPGFKILDDARNSLTEFMPVPVLSDLSLIPQSESILNPNFQSAIFSLNYQSLWFVNFLQDFIKWSSRKKHTSVQEYPKDLNKETLSGNKLFENVVHCEPNFQSVEKKANSNRPLLQSKVKTSGIQFQKLSAHIT